MKKIAAGLFALAATAAFAGSAHAQVPNVSPLALEVRAGAALPQGDFADGLDTGYGLNGNLTVNFMPALGAYVGYDYSSFSIDELEDVSVTDQGFSAGLRFSVPTPMLPIDPYLKGGVVYHKLGLDGEGGSIEFDNELGFEVGAGVGINILPKLQLTPGVTYSQFSTDFEDETGTESVDVKNLRVDVGLRLRI